MLSKLVEKKRENGSLVYRLDRERKKGEYFINPDSSQAKLLKKITFDGFRTFPRALYPTGFGFKVSGKQLLKPLYDKYGTKLRITLSASKPSSIHKAKTIVRVTLNETALTQVNRVVSEVKRKRRSEIEALVEEFLGEQFPRVFRRLTTGALKYYPNTIADLLEDEKVLNALSEKDKEALKATYLHLVGDMEFTLRSAKKVKFISDGIKTSQVVYLERIIEEFESKMEGSSSESVWQKFLHHHILTLLNTYAFVIEKQSVELDGKYPDFMLMDAYGYLDVYEIKKPQTPLLKYDQGRSNYYWDTGLAKAIVQTEKYISSVQRNRYELEANFRKKKLKARVVRPRGFIIAGRRADLDGEAIQEDFRVLNDSLKNIDIICFDDLLDNLKSLFDRLKSEAT